MTNTILQKGPTMICDFCSAQDPAWEYPADTFDLENSHCTSEGNWIACDTCAALINANDLRGLATRSMETFIERHPIEAVLVDGGASALYDDFVDTHRQFFQHRTGPVRPVQEEEIR